MKSKFLSFLIIFLEISFFQTYGQIKNFPKKPISKDVQLSDSLEIKNMKRTERSKIVFKISEYKIFNLEQDTIKVDTVLKLKNFYKFNTIFRDDLEKIPFSNIGLGYTSLALSSKNNLDFLPGFVAKQKENYYWFPLQVPFFKVPSAYSDLYYQNGIKQGQMLRAFLTANITPYLNFSLGYRGISSLGLYKNSTTSLGRLHTSWNFSSPNKKYKLKLFYLSQDINNDENGGIKDRNQFENSGETYKDRSRIDVNLIDAKSLLKGSQFFVNQSLTPFKQTPLVWVNETYYHKRVFQFTQSNPTPDFFGESLTSSEIKDSIQLKQFYHLSTVDFKYKAFQIKTGLAYIYNHYYADSLKIINGNIIPAGLVYQDFSWNSQVDFTYKKIKIKSALDMIPTDNLKGYQFKTEFIFSSDSLFHSKIGFTSSSHHPDFKYVLFQSAYKNLNWYNPDLKNIFRQDIYTEFQRKQWGKASFKQSLINNYTYFSSDTIPSQSASGVLYSSIKYSNDIQFYKFGFSPEVLLQKVIKGKEVLSLPSYVLRGSVYYSDRFFNRHLQIQTGITAKYFDSFYAPYYHPVLGDFLVQNQEKIGDFPILDLFFNFKVKRFRFYLKAEHFNALWEYKKPRYYVAPGYPYRDFVLRFGIHWIFFN